MPVYFYNTDPNSLFPAASSYSKDYVDQLFSGLTTDGVTQSSLTYAIQDFISETEINTIISDYTIDYISTTEINNKFDDATRNFWTSDEIDSALSAYTSLFYNSEQLDVFASGRTSNYPELTDVYDNAYTEIETSQEYWHPEPFYKRTLYTDSDLYILGGNIGNTVDIFVSGNTYWEVSQYDGERGSSPPEAWYSFSQTTGDTSLTITITAEQNNQTGSARDVNLQFNAVQVAGSPFLVNLEQGVYIPK